MHFTCLSTSSKALRFCTALLLAAGPVAAQIPLPPTNVKSPNATSLGLYGEVPVSLFTGIPRIDIPLYTVQDNKANLPISLSYHASGFRPDVHPGWVGSGWNLNVGGVISRTIHDMPDDNDDNGPTHPYLRQAGYYWYRNRVGLGRSNWNATDFMQSVARLYDKQSDNPYFPNETNSCMGYMDTEPDEFTFSFGEYSGKFYLDAFDPASNNATPQWKVKCTKPLKVTLDAVNYPVTLPSGLSGPYAHPSPNNIAKTFSGFRITTEDGTQYVFGTNSTSIEYDVDFFNQGKSDYPWHATSWYLTQIIYPNSQSVTLTYQRGAYIAQLSPSDYLEISTTNTDCQYPASGSTMHSLSGKLISPVYLASIQTNSTTVTFASEASNELSYSYSQEFSGRSLPYDQGFADYLEQVGNTNGALITQAALDRLSWRKLTSIRIAQTGTNAVIKTYNFGYAPDPNRTIRLTLKTLQEVGADGATKPTYQFAYNESQPQPRYLAEQSDHWGFYNASYSGSAGYSNYYAARNPVNTAVSNNHLLGILTNITYPTGGITTFEYEQHRAGRHVSEDRTNVVLDGTAVAVGGLRIKKITTHADGFPDVVKEYLYVINYKNSAQSNLPSSGVLGAQVRYYFDDYTVHSYNAPAAYYNKTVFSSQSVLPGSSNSCGTHIGYSEVVEKRSDGSYTISKFTNFDNSAYWDDRADNRLSPEATVAPSARQNYAYDPFSSRADDRGKLVSEDVWSTDDRRVKSHQIIYQPFDKATEYVPALKARYFSICPASPPGINAQDVPVSTFLRVEEGTAYRFYTYSFLPTQETESTYGDAKDNPIVTVRNLYYKYFRGKNTGLLAQESTTNSRGQVLTTSYTYPFDITTPATGITDPAAQTLAAMPGKNMLGYPVQTVTLLNNTQLVKANTITYRAFGPTGSIYPYQVFQADVAQPFTSSSFTALKYSTAGNDATLVIDSHLNPTAPKFTFTNYDALGNVVDALKEGFMKSSYLWNAAGLVPIAEVQNAASTEVFHDDFEDANKWDGVISYDKKMAHTGHVGGVLVAPTPGATTSSYGATGVTVTLAAPKQYIFSGWVYTEGPQASLWLFKNTPTDAANRNYTADSSPASVTNESVAPANQQVGRWIYLEQQVLVPPGTTQLTVRLTGKCGPSNTPGNGHVWFDNIRLYPADAQIISYTNDPLIGVTSISDVNSLPTYYEYDGLQRLHTVRDSQGNILKSTEYNFKRH